MKTNRFFSVVVIVLAVLVLSSCATAVKKVDGDKALSLWNDDARAKKELIAYMQAITDPESPDFIPVDRRVAVFDFDGTLFCETDLDYFDHTLLAYRVTEDENYKNQASDFEKYVANEIITKSQSSSPVSGLDVVHGQAVASAFKGMTPEQFIAYIQGFKKTPMPHYTGMNRGDGFYLPMLEVVNYLIDNDFTVFIVTGTDRYILRGIFQDSPLSFIPPAQIIGSEESIVVESQGDPNGLEYTFKADDKVVLGGDFLVKNLKTNKVFIIVKEIGVQPVLSFGNSSGDASMHEYTINNNQYRSLAFMLCCDDLERENGNQKKADDMYSQCAEFGWVPISMKNDWTTIYGNNVTYIK